MHPQLAVHHAAAVARDAHLQGRSKPGTEDRQVVKAFMQMWQEEGCSTEPGCQLQTIPETPGGQRRAGRQAGSRAAAQPRRTLQVPTIAFELWMVRLMYSSIASSLSAAGPGQAGRRAGGRTSVETRRRRATA